MDDLAFAAIRRFGFHATAAFIIGCLGFYRNRRDSSAAEMHIERDSRVGEQQQENEQQGCHLLQFHGPKLAKNISQRVNEMLFFVLLFLVVKRRNKQQQQQRLDQEPPDIEQQKVIPRIRKQQY